MSALDIEKERRDFEAWAQGEDQATGRYSDGEYVTPTNYLWQGWLAAKRAAQPAITDEPMGYAMFRNGKQVGIERSKSQADRWVDAVAVPLGPMNASAAQPAVAAIDYDALVESMCLTMRHDFGLDRLPEDEPISSGMTTSEREALRRNMRQLVENCIKPAIAAHVSGQGGIPAVLLDPRAVYDEIARTKSKAYCGSPDVVADALDAVVLLLRKDRVSGQGGEDAR